MKTSTLIDKPPGLNEFMKEIRTSRPLKGGGLLITDLHYPNCGHRSLSAAGIGCLISASDLKWLQGYAWFRAPGGMPQEAYVDLRYE